MLTKRTIRVLGIESSCDETAAAVVEVESQASGLRSQAFNFRILSSVVASQVKIHAKYGGVVPEVAAREHVGKIIPVIAAAITGSDKREATSRKQRSANNV